MKNLDFYLQKAIVNIEEDRKITRQLLDDVISYLSADEMRHKDAGLIAAKYVETLQRSNEQLVKLSTIILKKQNDSGALSQSDKDEIFDLLQKGGDNGKSN
jgi:hypothetical protein